MANASANQDNTNKKQAESKDERRKPPEGFRNETRPDIMGWVKAEPGVVVHARIHSMIGFKGDDGKFREVFLIKLIEPLKCYKKNDEVVELKAGDTAGLACSYALSTLREYVTEQGTFWCEFMKQEKIKGGRKVWKVNLHCKGTKSAAYFVPRGGATNAAAGADEADGADDDDNVPF